ncbi:restriction endonuclease subunit S [Neisseria meningitidis]|uniref:restriction endonuclease subunit S n=1 Tax=Neisseria meningitidis TaxID=487 RepID=UPI0002D596FD|nr:restriction endonuclease subunit S [Neisseria meningitidis]MBH2181717.1 restriction endonuclease subunit S [Neisseria meningitidis]MBH2224550.1 restriction endonuclease subunit S [Neisseria meningitidis]MBH2237747.1 restriction endonuclease subunit S [Neisseria meningitidis]MBH2303012.1 restriction endonuclease subunit S [Neisseria meningitidis]MBH2402312.1 restriction endonuclease subunit S [Neisseria meningitidis]
MIEKRLIDISKNISSGITPLRSNDEFWTDGTIPWLKTEQLGEKYIFDTNEYITEKALQEANVKIFPENTLSIAMYGEGKTRGNVSILKRPMATNQACCNIELDEEKVSSEYVYYFLKTQYENLRGLSSGIRKNLNTNDIKNFVVRLPENLKTQQSIAAVLSALDKKIALNKQINARLEEMAKTLYDYWFVQFDFPDANGKPYKSSGGEMVFDETLKREIPKGWEVKSLWKIAKYFNGLALQKYRPENELDDFLPVIKIREMNEGVSSNTERAKTNIPKEAIIDDGDILFSWSATLEIKIWSQGKGALNQHIFKVTSSEYPKYFFYFELLNYLKHFKMIADLRKTTMGHITQDHLKQAYICIPSQPLLEKLEKIVTPIFQKILITQKQNHQLTQLRDFLLPMLMNGQVSVAE